MNQMTSVATDRSDRTATLLHDDLYDELDNDATAWSPAAGHSSEAEHDPRRTTREVLADIIDQGVRRSSSSRSTTSNPLG